MGTFHDDLGPLHGMTVVVDTTGPRIVVGRCHEATEESVILVGAAVHEEGQDGLTKADYVEKVARLGYWEKHARFTLPRHEVVSVRTLGEVAAEM